jgi:hypothetical protein
MGKTMGTSWEKIGKSTINMGKHRKINDKYGKT